MLWLNSINGFSGITHITGYYYMMHNIVNINLVPLLYLAFDSDARYDGTIKPA